jgi:DNA invertase Pin-like site-specific DNA recombinase
MAKISKNGNKSKVGIYARVSSEKQAGEDHYSIDAQLNEMREFAEAKGWDVIAQFVDEGISGTKRERPELNALLDMARRHEVDVVLVHELSRLSRSVYHTLDIFDLLGKYQVGFASVKDPDFDFADPSKRFFLTIMAAINEYYIELLRQHTSKAKRERAKQGLYNASLMPYGYDLSGDPHRPAVINPAEAQVVRLAFESYSTGRFSDQDIADLLNQKEYRARSGRRFTKDVVTQMINSPFYIGMTTYRNNASGEKEVFEGQHEALISLDVWEKCQEVRSSRRSASRSVQKNFRHYLLSQLAVCDVCGRTLRAQGATTGSYYREMSYERGYIDCPHQRTGVRAEVVEQQMHHLVDYIQLPQDWLEQASSEVGDDEEIIQLRRQRDRLEAERRRLQQMRIEGDFDDNMDYYHEEMERIRRETASLPTYDQIETLRTTASAIHDLASVWKMGDAGDQRDLLRLMLREVKVDVPNGRITSISPLAVFLPIFREMPLLREQGFGEFIPLWQDHPGSAPNAQTILPAVQEPGDAALTDPFFEHNPLQPAEGARNTPGIAEALRLARESTKRVDVDIAQLVLDGLPTLPMDLRKWPGVSGDLITEAGFQALPPASLDVLVTQFALYKNGQSQAAHFAGSLRPGGVWYFMELLPLDCRGHWLFHALPSAWEHLKHDRWTLYSFYNRLQEMGMALTLKRHAFSQPVSAVAARAALERRPGILNGLPVSAFSEAFARLERGTISSEFTIIEGWAQKK